CLGYYSETIGSVFFSQLRDADAGLNTIRNCFSVLLEAATNAPRRSCLNVNSAAELAHRDHEVRKHIRGYDRHVRSCFHAALQSAQRRGETTDDADLEAHAAHLSISAQGLLLQAKAQPPKKAVQSYVSLVLASLPERE
ncbi:MAG: TetR family transcriptional regulator C-terminal domain-containing protein, partial [Myxococcota bacterium]